MQGLEAGHEGLLCVGKEKGIRVGGGVAVKGGDGGEGVMRREERFKRYF